MHNNTSKNLDICQYGKLYKDDLALLVGASGGEALTFMCLAIHAHNDQRVAFPSTTTIQNLTGLSRGSVLRAISKLKEKGAITVVGKTATGVIKYKIGGIKSDTRLRSDTRIKSDTRLRSDTTPRLRSDTPPVSDLIPIKLKAKTKVIKLLAKASYEKDVLLFVEFWHKWHDQPFTAWESENPLQDYQEIRASILQLWKQNKYQKDIFYELQVADIFIMQKKQANVVSFWHGDRWKGGLYKWLSSASKSHMGGNRKAFIPHVINIKPSQQEENTEEPSTPLQGATNPDRWIDQLQDNLEAYELHKEVDTYHQGLDYIYNLMQNQLQDEAIQQILRHPKMNILTQYLQEK